MAHSRWVVFDLDGTLSNAAHRVHLAQAGQWDAFHAAGAHDPVYADMAELFSNLADYYDILILTGRTANHEKSTRNWLAANKVYPDELIMRPVGDYRLDGQFKIAMLEKFFGGKKNVLGDVFMVIEDRDQVVEALRDYGLRVLQCKASDGT